MFISQDEEGLKKAFSNALKSLMSEGGVSESTLSQETGISQSAVNRIKNGVVSPTLFQAIKIADFFKLSIDKLLVKANPDDENDDNKYIPIINSDDILAKGNKNIQGFFQSNDEMRNSIGLKYGKSFSCGLLNKDTVFIVRKINKFIPHGTTLLFLDNKKFKIGNYSNGKVKPIDNLLTSFDINKINIIGTIIKMETNYIKEKSTIEKIIDSIGHNKLNQIIESRLAFSF